MKTLKDYIYEVSLLDIEGTIKANDKVIIKQNIEKWIKDNFRVIGLKLSDNPNHNGKYEVSANNITVKNRNIRSLTNELFVWKEVNSFFDCTHCTSLTSLEGAPEKVDGDFGCSYCDSLTSLEGSPKKVGGDFYCHCCHSLKSLEGAPKYVGGYFDCNCCSSLISIKGAPKEIDGDFYCRNCKFLKSKDLPTTTKIKGEIYV